MHYQRCLVREVTKELSSDFDKRRVQRLAGAHNDVVNFVGRHLEDCVATAQYEQSKKLREALTESTTDSESEEPSGDDDSIAESHLHEDSETKEEEDQVQESSSGLPFELYDLADVKLDDNLLRGNEACLEWLESLAKSKHREKSLPVCTDEQVSHLRELTPLFPNMRDALKVVTGAASLSAKWGLSFQSPPLLINGPPGVGKTEVVRRLAEHLDLPLIYINMAHLAGRFELLGGHRTWKQSEPGIVFKKLMECPVGNPIVLFDEAELGEPKLYQPLYHLVEDDQVTDHYLDVPFNVSKLNLIFITNDKYLLPEALRSRLFEFDVKQPTRAQMKQIIQRIYHYVVMNNDIFVDFDLTLPDDCVNYLLSEPIRVAKKRIFAALCLAAYEGDHQRLSVDDFYLDQQVVRRMGFTSEVSS